MFSFKLCVPLYALLLLLCAGAFGPVAAQEKPASTQTQSPPKPTPDVQVLLDRANALLNAKKYPEALQGFEAAQAKAHSVQDAVGEAEALRSSGVAYIYSGQPARAIPFLQQALTILHAIGYSTGEAGVLRNFGLAYTNSDQPQKALEYLQQSLKLYRAVEDKAGQAAIFRLIGSIYFATEPQKALEQFQQSLTLYRTVGDKAGEANVLTNIDFIYVNIGERDKALEYAQQRLSLARAIGDKREEARALSHISWVYNHFEQPQKGLPYSKQAVTLFRAMGDKPREVDALRGLYDCYTSLNEMQKALETCQQVQQLYRALGDKDGEAENDINLSAIYHVAGEPQKGLEFLQQALSLARAERLSGESQVLFRIGMMERELGRYTEALEHLQTALTLPDPETATIMRILGLVHMEMGHYPQALDYLQQSKTAGLSNSTDKYFNDLYKILWLLDSGEVYYRSGDYPKALDNAQKGLTYTLSMAGYGSRTPEEIAVHALTLLGNVYTAMHQPERALTFYRKLVARYEQVRNGFGANPQQRQDYLLSVLQTYHRTLALLVQQKYYSEAFALAQKMKARSLLDILASGKADLSAVLTPQERQQEQELRQQADDLNRRMVKEGVENEAGAKKRYAADQQQLKQTEQQLDFLEDALKARHPGLQDKRVARTCTLADVAGFLPHDAALLEYLQLSKSQLELFVVTMKAGRPQIQVVPIEIEEKALAKRCANFRAACADPRNAWKPQAKQMYSLLLEKARPLLAGKKRLILCPDGPLWDVPFAVLTDGRGRPLLSRFVLSLAYSATGAQASFTVRPHSGKKLGTLLCFANPDFGDAKRFGDLDGVAGQRPIELPSRPIELPSRPIELPSRPIELPSRPIELPSRPIELPSRLFASPSRPIELPSRQLQTLVVRGGIRALPGTQQEANAIQHAFPDARIYTGKAAQEETAQREMGKYRFLHFATHGFVNDTSPLLSSLVLAQPRQGSKEDGFLTAREIFGLPLNAELAVLSACNTGRGDARPGEGIIGLTWAFFAAGCPASVVSGWAVDDAGTATLMGDFYRRLKSGENKASALRRAALKLRGDGAHFHPYYWAPFFLIGNAR